MQYLALAICIGFGLAFVIANVRSWELEDSEAYWRAALRLRGGEPLYVQVDPAADEMIAYRYAPWFAWLWVPLTMLPRGTVQFGWSLVLMVSTVAAVLPLIRVRTVAAICLAALLGGLLIRTASTGNVHALLIAALVYGVPRRSGPVWIGVAASLKFVPILYALVYVGRGEWRRAAVAVVVGAAFIAPTLLYDLVNYPADPGESLALLSIAGPVPWAAVAIACAAVAVRLARGRRAWGAASVAVLAAIPRLQLYDLTYLLVGLGGPALSSSSRPVTSRKVMS
ncbi:MAG: glycosyltransferase 87 family protein [Candidatus Limnocylindria bacterium]